MIYYNHRLTFFLSNQIIVSLIDTLICIVVGILFKKTYIVIYSMIRKKIELILQHKRE